MKAKSIVGNQAPRTPNTGRFDPTSLRRLGFKLETVGFPAVRPDTGRGFRLVALVSGADWEYGVEVTDPAKYAELYEQVQRGGYMNLTDLYSLPERWLPSCLGA